MSGSSTFIRERKTIAAMVRIYCRSLHGGGRVLCEGCSELFAYAEQRIDKCLFPDNKPTCATCPVHCYKPAMREQVKTVMRFAGPRMIYHHPYLAIRHILDGRNKGPFVRRRPGEAVAPGDPHGTSGNDVPSAPGSEAAGTESSRCAAATETDRVGRPVGSN